MATTGQLSRVGRADGHDPLGRVAVVWTAWQDGDPLRLGALEVLGVAWGLTMNVDWALEKLNELDIGIEELPLARGQGW
ncbi:hypothetical protein NCCP1664_25080 [Zafaria cholistanensis]|uniref:Uncharacterized protein n=1 Tax=Zafaria cholistanensis TaxID=1682741 RepID=A0A5A7NTA0_9MICC|nr:hypothetical protein NCCP1664_25080 [Zafaria cholistanensis]